MAAPKRTDFERERDLDRTADMYLENMTQQEIADAIGVSRQQIGADIKELERRWQKASIEKITKRKARTLQKVGKLEKHAWRMLHKTNREMYEAMKEEGTRDGAAFDRLSKKISESASDPRWAKVLLDCWKRESDMLGMDAPDKLALTDTAGKDIDPLSPEACARQAADMLRKMRARKEAKASAPADEAGDDAEDDDAP